MTRFITQLQVEPIIGTTKRKLLSPLVYDDELLGAITIPRDYVTDYASIPKWIPRWFLDQDGPLIRIASVVHDFGYTRGGRYRYGVRLSREQVDALFERIMLRMIEEYLPVLVKNGPAADEAHPIAKQRYTLAAKAAHKAVRIFGGSHWSPRG
ncbi:MAG: hypothetical protein DRR06_20425 [Gammaproteobacteria bacterium]|nr:MAG: hypothetical protein DRR06_20425 [Gammaproteobacteria bacterium]